jgi:hypothetical protein
VKEVLRLAHELGYSNRQIQESHARFELRRPGQAKRGPGSQKGSLSMCYDPG